MLPSVLRLFIEVVAPVLLIVAAGWIYSTRRNVDVKGLTDLIIYLLMPCLILHGLLSMGRPAAALFALPVAVGLSMLLLILGTWLMLRALPRRNGRTMRGLYLPVVFQNSGNMGIPMAQLAFGEEGFALALLFFAIISFYHYTVGIALAKGGRGGLTEFLKLPLVYVLVIGLGAAQSGWAAPPWLLVPLKMLGTASLPMMLFALGAQLRSARLTALPVAVAASVLRLGGGYAAALIASRLAGLEGMAHNVFVLLSVMPAAIMNFALAEKYDADPDEVSSTIVVSTLMCIPVIPVVLSTLK